MLSIIVIVIIIIIIITTITATLGQTSASQRTLVDFLSSAIKSLTSEEEDTSKVHIC